MARSRRGNPDPNPDGHLPYRIPGGMPVGERMIDDFLAHKYGCFVLIDASLGCNCGHDKAVDELCALRAENERMSIAEKRDIADILMLTGTLKQLRAELDKQTKAAEEARITMQVIHYYSDDEFIKNNCNSWLTAHPAKEGENA
jgi:hypothetical protein